MKKIKIDLKEKNDVLNELNDFLTLFKTKKEYFEKHGIKLEIKRLY